MAWGRVALLLAAAESTKAHIGEVARIVAYSPKPEAHKKPSIPMLPGGINNDAENTLTDSIQKNTPKMIFWQITKIITLKDPDNIPPEFLKDKSKAAQFNPNKKGTFVFESPRPLVTLTQLAPLLINTLGRKVTGRHLDHSKIFRCISQGKPIKQLWYQQQSKWPLQLSVIVDKHIELYPYWLDYDAIVKQLQAQLGKSNVQVITLHERNLYDFVAKNDHLYPALLILSDLNDYANSHRYWAWQEILEYVQQQTTHILTLSSATQAPPRDILITKARVNSLKPLNGFTRHAKKHRFKIPVSQAQMDVALTMISPLAMVDNGLLRKLRAYFMWGSAALEGEIWNDKRVVQSAMGIRLQDTDQEKYRKRFTELSAGTQHRYWALVDAQHKNAYQGLLNLEGISKMALSKTTESFQSQTIEHLQSLLAYHHQTATDKTQKQLDKQLASLVYFVPQLAWKSSKELSKLLHQTYALAYQEDIRKGNWQQSLPAGLDPNDIPPADGLVKQSELQYSLRSYGVAGEARVYQDADKSALTLLNYTASNSQPAFWQAAANEMQIPIKDGLSLKLRENQTHLIKTAKKQWKIKKITLPVFAQNIGQDQQGLFIETELNNPEKRYYWLPAEEGKNQKKLAGVWFPKKQLAEDIRRDQYGIYTDIKIKNITQRFRYISPGTFKMGSPEDESEREPWSAKETQHQVTLTEGFWLADTTVTQALYQTVMAKNPSDFRDDQNNPVEKVSWDDAQQFIEKLNKIIPTLQARLPTEAQWEYACRAGSLTPFSFGDNIMPEQVNYHGDYPYAGDKKGLYRKKTVAVKSLPANDWGLYEMHGNVWEWCADGYQEDLGEQPVSDPVVTGMGARLVSRGGCWSDVGKHLRSAMRYGSVSDLRFSSGFGLRLSLGLELQPSQDKSALTASRQSRRDDAKEPDGE